MIDRAPRGTARQKPFSYSASPLPALAFLDPMIGKGELIYKGLLPSHLLIGIASFFILLVLAWRLQVGSHKRWLRLLTSTFRIFAVLIILFLLMEPVIRTEEELPQESFLVHLFDNSASMGIKDFDGTQRLERIQRVLDVDQPKVTAALEKQYRSLLFSFSDSLNVADDRGSLKTSEKPTDMIAALRALELHTKGLPVSGIVLYSDGNPSLNPNRKALIQAASQLQIPIYAVGSAPENPGPDFWIEKVISPQEVVRGVVSNISVLVGAHNVVGKTVDLTLKEGDNVIETRQLTAVAADQVLSAEFKIRSTAEGLKRYHVNVKASFQEAYPWNNDEDFFLRTIQNKARILYVEGYPRYEYRFLRAAFEEDERFQVTSMVFTTPQGQIYRQGLNSETELASGFPKTEQELFGYDIVVIGDVSASLFTAEQLKLLSEFVSKRGGGLLFLAGSNSFSPNGFGATALADVLPFQFTNSPELEEEYRVIPTTVGRERSILGTSEPGKAPPWEALPPLKGLFPLASLKPGAIALCNVDLQRGEKNPPVVAFQRYGGGTTLVCGISGTWPWRFQTTSENTSYQAFWKEMSLILAQGSKARVNIEAAPGIGAVGADIAIQGAVFDKEFKINPSAAVDIEIEAPDGTKTTIKPASCSEANYTFRQTMKATKAGIYHIRAGAQIPGDSERLTNEAAFIARSENPEFREIRLNEGLMREIATSTGGDYIHISKYAELPTKIHPRKGASSKIHEYAIWDRSLLLLSLLALLVLEWLIRRLGRMA